MKPLALIVCLLVATTARAGVDPKLFGKLYGTLDVYGDWAPGANGSPSLRSGGMSPSYVGLLAGATFTDRESLTLDVESLVNLVDLKFSNISIGDRRAAATLATRWGNLSGGRQFTPHVWFLGGEIDAFQLGFSGSPYVILAGGVNLMLRTRSVMYETPRLWGLSAEVMIARDAAVDDGKPTGSNDVHARLDYRRRGLYLGAVYVDQRQLHGNEHRQYAALGGSYERGPIVVSLAAQRVFAAASNARFTEALAGLKLRFGKHLILGSAAFSHADDGNAGAQLYAIAYAYAVTTRITVYASAAWIGNFGASQFDMGSPVPPGGSISDFMAGVRVRF